MKAILDELTSHAESIKSDAPANVSLEIGDNCRQGDLYICRIGGIPKSGKARINRQLADGTTQGSRHVLDGQCKLYDVPVTDAIARINDDCGSDLRDYQIGPMFETNGPVTVRHPEHGDRTLSEPGCYAVVYQRALTADEREERARD